MPHAKLNARGRIAREFHPAVYLDTSVLIVYTMTAEEGMPEWVAGPRRRLSRHHSRIQRVVREVLEQDNRTRATAALRERLLGEPRAAAIVSPIAVMEYLEWYADAVFKDLAAHSAGSRFIGRGNKKEIGGLLSQILIERGEDLSRAEDTLDGQTPLDVILEQVRPNPAEIDAHAFAGLHVVDLVNFRVTYGDAWNDTDLYAAMQLGAADILHIKAAQHLGCEYIASYDRDFVRVAHIIRERTGIELLYGPDRVLEVF